jgi:uncharacterized membrane protein YobD (UPF0266 family)
MQGQLEHRLTCLIFTFPPAFFSTKYFRESPENDFTLLFGLFLMVYFITWLKQPNLERNQKPAYFLGTKNVYSFLLHKSDNRKTTTNEFNA